MTMLYHVIRGLLEAVLLRLALLAAGLEVGLHLGGARLYYTIYNYDYMICVIHLYYTI